MFNVRTIVALLGAAFLTSLALPAEAVPVVVTSRAALGGNDFYDWGAEPVSGTHPQPFVAQSNAGLEATLTNPLGEIVELNQGVDWIGNFAFGDEVLWAQGALPDPSGNSELNISFEQAVFGVGAQIQSNAFGAFTAVLDLFDVSDNLLASFNLVGNSTPGGDNSAIFLGALDGVASIKRIRFSIVADGSFAINQLDIVSQQNSTVPEPATLGLLGVGLVGLGLARRKARAAGRSAPEANA